MALIYKPQDAVEMIVDKLKGSTLDIGYVGSYDEKKLPVYPAVVVSAGSRDKQIHGTHTFAITLRCLIWVYHAKISESHRNRALADLELVSEIEALLESDPEWWTDTPPTSQRLIFAHVENEMPGIIQSQTPKGTLVVGTRMTWMGLSQQRF